MSKIPIALQLYTVRDECEKDFVGTLRRVAEIGYRSVQMGDTYGLSSRDIKKVATEIGLSVCAIHVDLDELEANLDETLQNMHLLGCRFVTCPSLPKQRRTDADAWKAAAQILDSLGQRASLQGVQLSYHNHDFDLDPVGDSSGYEILMANTDRDSLCAEVDVYWAAFAGRDPVALIQSLDRRCPLIHLKDMADDESRSFTELGNGTLDFDAIIPACEAAGSQWLIVEQDSGSGPSLDSAATSLEFLRSKGWA